MTLVFSAVSDVVRPVTRFTSDRPVEADLRAGANRTIYGGGLANAGPSTRPECRVADVVTGEEVPTSPAGLVTLTLGSDEYQSLVHFRIERDGRYRITCANGRDRPVAMAVGPRLRVLRSAGRVFGAAGAVILSAVIAVPLIAVTAVKRREDHRRSQAQARS
ncbi:MAG: hypothetical protein M3N28_09660 [Actinomycetota bacterium]|nr:hypothetical protein [Actinomycetota bacterium]